MGRTRRLVVAAVCLAVVLGLAAAGSAHPQPATAVTASRGAASTRFAHTPIRHVFAHTPIRHVVVIDLENRSFDNLLGFWCDDIAAGAITREDGCPEGGMPSSVRLSNGAVVTPYVMPDTAPKVLHSVAAQLAAMNIRHGVPRMNGWEKIPNGTCSAARDYQCIGGYTPSQIPNITTLATDFAVSDDTFSLADSPSFGGHLYVAMASLDGFTGDNPSIPKGTKPGPGWGCNSDKIAPWARTPGGTVKMVPSCIPDYNLNSVRYPFGGAFKRTPVSPAPTIFDRLEAAGLSWKIYADNSSTAPHTGYNWSVCPSLAECLYTRERAHLVDATTFTPDAESGQLPAYSLITAGGSRGLVLDSCHNSLSTTACDNYIGSLVQAVEDGADWDSTAIFITFDDFGGFYDQVAPPVNPDGTQEGPRMPLIIVSPYARPGYTDSRHATMASILAYTEHIFGLAPLGANDAHAYDFSHAFDYSQAPLPPVPMVHRPLPASARYLEKHPPLAALDEAS